MDTLVCAGRTESMPPKLDKESATERAHFMLPGSLKQRIEDWRALQRPIPSFGHAVRQLIEDRLDDLAAKEKKKK